MPPPSTRPGDLARALVWHETGGSTDPAAVAGAVEGVCGMLTRDLKDTLGSRGVSSLMARALHLARREHPSLNGVVMDLGPDIMFMGLPEALATCGDEDVVTAGTSVLAQFLGLLVLLLGEDLGLQPVRKLWPHMASSVREIEE